MAKYTETRREPYSKFKGVLAEKNIKHKDIAELVDMSESSFSKKVNGKGSDFTIQDLRKICNELKIEAEIFFN